MKYERLTEKEKMNGAVCFDCKKCSKKTKCDGQCEEEAVKKLWELENKIENGTLIELPCKLGDTVYRIRKKPYPIVLERFVVKITLCFNHKGQYEWQIFTTTEDTLGKTVFLTKAEAEKKLKELKGEV